MAAAAVEQKTKTYTGKGIRPPKVGKHFLHIDDFSKEELWQMLQTSMKVAHQLPLPLPDASARRTTSCRKATFHRLLEIPNTCTRALKRDFLHEKSALRHRDARPAGEGEAEEQG